MNESERQPIQDTHELFPVYDIHTHTGDTDKKIRQYNIYAKFHNYLASWSQLIQEQYHQMDQETFLSYIEEQIQQQEYFILLYNSAKVIHPSSEKQLERYRRDFIRDFQYSEDLSTQEMTKNILTDFDLFYDQAFPHAQSIPYSNTTNIQDEILYQQGIEHDTKTDIANIKGNIYLINRFKQKIKDTDIDTEKHTQFLNSIQTILQQLPTFLKTLYLEISPTTAPISVQKIHEVAEAKYRMLERNSNNFLIQELTVSIDPSCSQELEVLWGVPYCSRLMYNILQNSSRAYESQWAQTIQHVLNANNIDTRDSIGLEALKQRLSEANIDSNLKRQFEEGPKRSVSIHIQKMTLQRYLAQRSQDETLKKGFTSNKNRPSTPDIREREYLFITVTDTGPGLPDEYPNILNEGFQTGKTGYSDHVHGTGIGMAEHQKFLESLDGGVILDNDINPITKEHLGARQTFYLPISSQV